MVHKLVVYKLVYHCFYYYVRAQKFPRVGKIFLRVAVSKLGDI